MKTTRYLTMEQHPFNPIFNYPVFVFFSIIPKLYSKNTINNNFFLLETLSYLFVINRVNNNEIKLFSLGKLRSMI